MDPVLRVATAKEEIEQRLLLEVKPTPEDVEEMQCDPSPERRSAAPALAVHPSSSPAPAAASGKDDEKSPSVILSQGMDGLSLQSPANQNPLSVPDAVSRRVAKGLDFEAAGASELSSSASGCAQAASSPRHMERVSSSSVGVARDLVEMQSLNDELKELRDVGEFLRRHIPRDGLGEGIFVQLCEDPVTQEGMLRDFAFEWHGWVELVLNARRMLEGGDMESLGPFVLNTIESFRRISRDNTGEVVVPSNDERLAQLKRLGYEHRIGKV